MVAAIKEFCLGLHSLATGLAVTLEQFFRRPVTVHYPWEVLELPARYRGHIVLVRDEQTGRLRCIACKMCERICPSDCIVVEGAKLPGESRKSVTEFKLDFTKCSLCGLCVEVCPVDALAFSKRYNLASTRKADYESMDLCELAKAGDAK
ncbi:MAG: NADH-quinone oxidoreductase subunit I [Verrucomicrobiae bacterium]|nr:NADH-quinone oxidoreductase subunit I [Verrucomicrobiae bacterium]MCX7722226.1 NADH-quinone oxidoreductase subunit I [Verrucomicrobiae bacterium]MDW7980693.1 NADH-quinone oxidoreductase subunit I [Verrucomicrobiales bacterium]